MNWYRHPQTVEALASRYVMGSMSRRSRRRLEQVMGQRAEVAQAVAWWAERAAPVALSLPALKPSASSWSRLSATLGLDGAGRGAPPVTPRWWQRWLAPLPAGALAMGLLMGISLPVVLRLASAPPVAESDMQLPASYVGVLATAEGRPGLIVSSLRRGTVVDLKVIAPVDVPAGQHLHLWRIDQDGVATSLGPIPATPGAKVWRMTLAQPAEEAFFAAVELAVSLESADATPAAPTAPTQPFVYRGLCGKVWK